MKTTKLGKHLLQCTCCPFGAKIHMSNISRIQKIFIVPIIITSSSGNVLIWLCYQPLHIVLVYSTWNKDIVLRRNVPHDITTWVGTLTYFYVDIIFRHSNYLTISQGVCWSVPRSTTPILHQCMLPCMHWFFLKFIVYYIYFHSPMINNTQDVGIVIDLVLCWTSYKYFATFLPAQTHH